MTATLTSGTKPAPPCDTSSKSDAWHYVDNAGGASADLDLTNLGAGYPRFAPQKTTLWVDSVGASIVLQDEDAHQVALPVAPGVPLVFTRPVAFIIDSGTGDVNAMFEWFDPVGSTDWK